MLGMLGWSRYPGCFVLLAAVQANVLSDIRDLIASQPDKKDVVETTSHAFKWDLARYCFTQGRCANSTVAELGCWAGHSTALLSRLFRRVFVLDVSPKNLAKARAANKDRTNIIYLQYDLYDGAQPFSWASLVHGNDINVVFIDAAHTSTAVAQDLDAAMSLPSLETIILDDFGQMREVRRPVFDAIDARQLTCFGIGKPWRELSVEVGAKPPFEKEDYWWLREGAVCKVIASGMRSRWHLSLVNTSFSCYYLDEAAGLLVPGDSFLFHIKDSTLEFRWPSAAARSKNRTPVTVPYRLHPELYSFMLLERVPQVPMQVYFGARMRSGAFLSDDPPHYPACACRVWEDVYRLTRSTVKEAQEARLMPFSWIPLA
ncbi:unnamed protein product [Polarella glacialis]|uniref:Methyltransferase domain-containing protein n=1 Tax=Polarella glacialis TaxID=89957 RepID=A0A813KYK6_POLGL|nr:unnamed protein product [Polarella glacialis]